jgi:hypothetical protein
VQLHFYINIVKINAPIGAFAYFYLKKYMIATRGAIALQRKKDEQLNGKPFWLFFLNNMEKLGDKSITFTLEIR